jgi:hypothetical protein
MENALNSEKSLKNLPFSTNFGPKPKLQSLNEQKTISLYCSLNGSRKNTKN